MKKGHKVIVVAAVISVLLIAVAICLLPWPTRISATMYAAVVTPDGEVQNTLEFTLGGWKRDYLFRDDDLNLNIVFKDDGNAPFHSAETNTLNTLDGSLISAYYSTSPAFWSRGFTTGLIVFTKDFQYCAMSMVSFVGETAVQSPTCIVASTNPDFDPAEVLKTFENFHLTP